MNQLDDLTSVTIPSPTCPAGDLEVKQELEEYREKMRETPPDKKAYISQLEEIKEELRI